MSKGRFSALAIAVFSVLLLGNWADRAPAQGERGGSGDGRGQRGDVTLKIRGDEGTRFSGTCSVGGERREISGQAPESFEFDLKGRSLSCEIGKQGGKGNDLEVVLSGDNVHIVQRSAAEQGTSKITYDGDGSVSTVSSSSRTAAGDDRGPSLSKSEEEALESLDDRIKQMLNDIFERVMP